MDATTIEARAWAVETFEFANFGHLSRKTRVIQMATQAALHPAGKISEVFTNTAEAEGAYRLLENPSVSAEEMVKGLAAACARRSAEYEFVYVPVDGSSVSLVDVKHAKDFGPLGTKRSGGRGVKVLGAIAVSPEGVPLGVSALEWWSRSKSPKPKKPNAAVPTKEKETQRWLDAVTHTCESFELFAPETRLWFQLDREADSWPLLHHLAATQHWFTVRASRNRRLAGIKGSRRKLLRSKLAKARVRAEFQVDVPGNRHHTAHTARLVVRAATVVLELRDPWSKTCRPLSVQAVWVRESGTTRRKEKPLEWMLYTNHPIDSAEDVLKIVAGYCQRWRIEDFHKTWKSGECNVEQSQLRTTASVTKWATLLAAVALRTERLKFLSRTQPDLPASVELTRYEIRALVLWKRRNKKRNEVIPDGIPPLRLASIWLAELGGYTGKSSGGPPGSIVLGRGFERLRQRAAALEDLDFSRKK